MSDAQNAIPAAATDTQGRLDALVIAQHTPGPWVYDRFMQPGCNRAYITTVARCCEYVIGLQSDYPGGNYRDGDPTGDPEADARLIAAAPELLAALCGLLNAVRRSTCDGSGPAQDMAAQAIYKATCSA